MSPAEALNSAAGGLSIVGALQEMSPEIALYIGVQVAGFMPVFVLVRWAWPNHKDPWSLADTIVSLAIFPVLTYSAIVAALDLRHDVESRWRGLTVESRFCFMLFSTRALLHMGMQCMEKMSRSHFILMTLHHVFSLFCFGGGLVYNRCHFWGALDACCEMSTIFLNNLYLSKELTIGGRELKELMPSWLFGLNGFLLWLSFLVFRIILFPIWLYVWYNDVTTHQSLTWDRSNNLERYLYPGVTVMLLGLSSFWFVNVTKGMLKALGLSSGKKKEGKKEQ